MYKCSSLLRQVTDIVVVEIKLVSLSDNKWHCIVDLFVMSNIIHVDILGDVVFSHFGKLDYHKFQVNIKKYS